MLAIRMQRTGRKGHAQFRIIVQDARKSPKSGKVVELLGNYNPHTKDINLKKDLSQTYMNNGAQPSNTVARIFKQEGLKLPKWVMIDSTQKRKLKNPEKLRKNRPAEEPAKDEPVADEANASKEPEETQEPQETNAPQQSDPENSSGDSSAKTDETPQSDETPSGSPDSAEDKK